MIEPTLRQLEYAVAVADHEGFHRAARACHVSQPGLSAQIKLLEAQLGVRLFERDRRRVRTTAAGQRILPRARGLLTGARELVETAQLLARPFSLPVRLGVIPTIAPYWLPRVLPGLRRAHPELALQLREDQTQRLVEACREGELDLLLLACEADLQGLHTRSLARDEFVVAVPRGHRLSRRRELRESDLEGEAVLLLEDGHCLRDQALRVCDLGGASERMDLRATSLVTLVQMVASGAGITLLPEMALETEVREGDEIVVRRFRKPAPGRTIGLAWRPTSPREAEFLELAETLRPAPRDGRARRGPAVRR